MHKTSSRISNPLYSHINIRKQIFLSSQGKSELMTIYRQMRMANQNGHESRNGFIVYMHDINQLFCHRHCDNQPVAHFESAMHHARIKTKAFLGQHIIHNDDNFSFCKETGEAKNKFQHRKVNWMDKVCNEHNVSFLPQSCDHFAPSH